MQRVRQRVCAFARHTQALRRQVMGLRPEVGEEAGPLGVVLRGDVLVGAAAHQGLREGDPYPVHPTGPGGDACVAAEGGGGAVCPDVLDAAAPTPSDAARCHASSLPAHSAAQGLAARVRTPEAAVASTPRASATSAPQSRVSPSGVVSIAPSATRRTPPERCGRYTWVSTAASCAVAAGRTHTTKLTSAIVWNRRSWSGPSRPFQESGWLRARTLSRKSTLRESMALRLRRLFTHVDFVAKRHDSWRFQHPFFAPKKSISFFRPTPRVFSSWDTTTSPFLASRGAHIHPLFRAENCMIEIFWALQCPKI